MPCWTPTPIWQDEEVYILGGGPSLKDFPWHLLHDRNVIGCNDAFLLGPDVVDICMFGDYKFFTQFGNRLEKFAGVVVTNCPPLHKNNKLPWLYSVNRKSRGLHKDAVGWNCNTGAASANLAFILGAETVYLLGMDMGYGENGNTHWHPLELPAAKPSVFDKFIQGFHRVAEALEATFPNTRIVNVTDGSRLTCFPKQTLEEHFGKEYVRCLNSKQLC